jgi:hypothetical protein
MKIKLYQGSKNGNITLLQKRQAQAKDGVEVPEDELKEGIYLTSDYGFALAMAARPEGCTDIDDKEKIIKFEDPKLFKPEEQVYVYEVEIEEGSARQIDELQYLIEDLNNIEVSIKHEHLAKEIEKYYKIENMIPEIKTEF